MSPIGDGGWRLRYLGPWTWHTHGDQDGWAFPRRRFGWRLIVHARGQRLDIRGPLLDILEAGLHFPNVTPESGGRVTVRAFPHIRADTCNCQRTDLGMTGENSGNCPTHPLPGCPNPACGETWTEAFHGDHCDACDWSEIADRCDRCLPGYDGERIPIYLPGEVPCEHTRSDR